MTCFVLQVDFNILSGTFSNHALCMGVVFCAQYVLDKNLTLVRGTLLVGTFCNLL